MKRQVKRFLSLLLTVVMLTGMVPTFTTEAVGSVSTTGGAGDFRMAVNGGTSTIWVDAQEEAPVKRVVGDLQADVNRVTGRKPTISQEKSLPSGPVVLVGTLEHSTEIQKLIANGTITSAEVNAIRDKWEAYLIKVVNENMMVIVGSDNRGAIYGVYEISEQMGVSPWYYFADVPIQTKTNVYIPSGTSITDKPDVQYRGIFINDEEKLSRWVTNKFNPENGGSGTMGAEIYAKIFELILRLKGNYIWAAMHVNSFNNIQENIDTLHEYGVVLGSSHCDMLLRTNVHEWDSWKKSYASSHGLDAGKIVYDYTVNPDIVLQYWRENVQRHKDTDAQWTLGMRGAHDEAFNTANINDSKWDKYGTNEEDRKAGVLSEIITAQVKTLEEVLGKDKAEKAFKAFIPYKEVLPLYNNAKFSLPDDVTVIWCDDNHGMVRRTPTDAERNRKGGSGLYYHVSYWAPADQSYLWMSSLPLSVMGEELNKCWESGIQRSWILNVGDIKPEEGEMDYFIRCGWDIDKYTNDSVGFSTEWMKRNFGDKMSDGTAKEVADILNTFYQHTNVRKVDHMRLDIFEQTNYNEWDKRMEVYQDLFERSKAVADGLSTDAMRTAFYELVQCKINWAYYTNKAFYCAEKSNLSYDQGRMASADTFSQLSIEAERERKDEISYYSKIAGGKWDNFIDPENHAPPVTTQLPATTPALILGDTAMGVIVQGESMPVTGKSQMNFTQYHQDGKFIDIFNKGAGSFDWTAVSDKKWLTLSAKSGTVNDEQRLWITVNDYDAAKGDTATITIKGKGAKKTVKVTVDSVDAGIVDSYVESDGYVSMQAEHYTSKSDVNGKTWELLKNTGRGFDGDMMRTFDSALGMVDQNNISTATSPSLSYNFYLTSSGTFPLEVYRLPTMNARPGGQVRFAVSVDDKTPIIVSSTATDEGTTSSQNPQWVKNLFRQIEKHVITLPELSAGKHTLKLWMVDNMISIDKMVIYTDGEIPVSALGPDESYHSKYNSEFQDSVSTINRKTTEIKTKNIPDTWGAGAFVEKSGAVSIEAEYAMENVLDSKNQVTDDMYAYTVSKWEAASSVSGKIPNAWRLTQSDTGLGMRLPDKAGQWSDGAQFSPYSPELSYKVSFGTSGSYNVWVRWRFVDNASDSIRGGLDGVYVNDSFTGGGGFHSYEKDEKWYWQKVGTVNVSSTGQHTFSLWMREDGLHLDRIYLTKGSETPSDNSWSVSSRTEDQTKQTLKKEVESKRTQMGSTSYPLGTPMGCYSKSAYNALLDTLADAEKMAESGNLTKNKADKAIAAIEAADQALTDSQILKEDNVTYNAYRDFENDTVGKYPYGFTTEALTNGATATIKEENGNKYLNLSTTSTPGKANIYLPYAGEVSSASDQRVVISFRARFTGTFQYANGAMIRNDSDLTNPKHAMVTAFENANQVQELRVQNGSTKTKVQNFTSGTWYSIKMIGNFDGKTYTVYIDDQEVATDYTFRDAGGSKLIGQFFGIDGYANGSMDYDDFRVRVVTPIKVACIGDSITYGSSGVGGRVNAAGRYPNQLQALLGEDYLVQNFGVSGACMINTGTDSGNAKKGYIYQSSYTNSQNFQPDIVIIKLGTNDSKALNWDTMSGSYVNDALAMIQSYRNLDSEPMVYIATSATVLEGKNNYGIQRDVVHNEIVPLQKQIAQTAGTGLIDVHKATENATTDQFPDRVHGNKDGYAMIAQAVFEVLNASTLANAVNEKRAKLAQYSYPLGNDAGCYRQSDYNALIDALDRAENLAKSGSVTKMESNIAIKEIKDAWQTLDNSINLTDGKVTYNAYRDFENDTVGNLLPYGIEATRIDNGGAVSIVKENGNSFLRLTTGSQNGHVNMFLPYVKEVTANIDEKVIVEYSARFNQTLRYANAFQALNQSGKPATTIAFENVDQQHKIVLKKSASSSIMPADFDYDTWYDFKAVINMNAQTYTVYMNGTAIAEDYSFRTVGSTVLTGHILGIDGFSNGQVDFDNFKVYVTADEDEEEEQPITTVPETTSSQEGDVTTTSSVEETTPFEMTTSSLGTDVTTSVSGDITSTLTDEETTTQDFGYDPGFRLEDLDYITLECVDQEGLTLDYAIQSTTIDGLTPWYGDGGNTLSLQFSADAGVVSDITVNGKTAIDGLILEKAAGVVKMNPEKLDDNAYSVIKVTTANGEFVFVVKKGISKDIPTTGETTPSSETDGTTPFDDVTTSPGGEVTTPDEITSIDGTTTSGGDITTPSGNVTTISIDTTTLSGGGNVTTAVPTTKVSVSVVTLTTKATAAKVAVGKTKVKKVSLKKAKIKLKKISGAKYQIKISTTKKFKKKKTVTKKVAKIKFTVKSKKIKGKRILYVKARAYKVVNGITYYGKWSKIKKVKVKK